jgi:ribosomal protein S18 acetylase RimI-like enzyme
MEFIRATEEDLTEIIRIFLSCWHIAYVDVLAEEVRTAMDEKAARALWETSFVNSDRDTFLVKDGSSNVAVFRTGIDPEEENTWHLFSLYVDPICAGRGIGGAVMKEFFEAGKKKDKSRYSLWVFASNAPAKGLYLKNGFRPSGRTRIRDSWGEVEEELVKVDI